MFKLKAPIEHAPVDPSRVFVSIGSNPHLSQPLAPGNSRPRVGFIVTEFEAVPVLDNDGHWTEGRKPIVRRDANATYVPSSRLVEAWNFLEQYEPGGNWCTASEWQEILKACAPAAAADKASWQADEAWRMSEAEKARQAAEARQNPQAELARGIAAGVAQALAQLEAKTGGRA